jgi:uncharacterized protein involved in exopolysaccharide biosynthesis
MSEQTQQFAGETPAPASEGFGFIDLLIVCGKHKKMLVGLPVLGGALALSVSLMLTPIFTSTARVLPPQQQNSAAAAMFGQLGGVAGLAGLPGLKTPSDVYIGMLKSRTVADELIKRFDLKTRYEKQIMDDTRAALDGATEIADSKKDGMIAVSVSDRDPKFAAELANAYVDALSKMTQTFAVTDASQRRLFFEKQLKDAKDKLADAEVALRSTQEKTGMIAPEGQVKAIIESIAALKGRIAAKEVQISSTRTFATAQNPELIRAQEELRGMRAQLAQLEQKNGGQNGDLLGSSGGLPEVGIEYIRRLRDVKYYESMFEVLSKQYELARLDEARDSSVIQVLDTAVPAERKSKPKKALITIGGVLAGGVLALLLALAKEAIFRSRQEPRGAQRLRQLSAAWKR